MAQTKASIRPKHDRNAAKEHIINQFLLQFTSIIVGSIMLTIIYFGLLGAYGIGAIMGFQYTIWVGVYLFAAATIALFIAYKKTNSKRYLTLTLYSLSFFAGFAWLTLFQRFMVFVTRLINVKFLSLFANLQRLIQMQYILLGLALAAVIAMYFVKLNKMKKEVR